MFYKTYSKLQKKKWHHVTKSITPTYRYEKFNVPFPQLTGNYVQVAPPETQKHGAILKFTFINFSQNFLILSKFQYHSNKKKKHFSHHFIIKSNNTMSFNLKIKFKHKN